MIISELNHLEVVNQENRVVGGSYYGGSNIDVDIKKDYDVYVDVDVKEYKDFYVDSDVKGVSAFAEADASAYGYDAHAESMTFTHSDEYFATASAQSTSLSDKKYKY